jgi:hypothetical protein
VDANNYCPITLVPAFSKGFDKIIATKLASFINKPNIFSNIHFGTQTYKDAIVVDVTGYVDNKP